MSATCIQKHPNECSHYIHSWPPSTVSGTLVCTFYLITTPYFPSVSNSVCPLNMFAFKRLKRQRGTLLLPSILSILPLLWLVPSCTHTQATHTHSQPISGLDHRLQAHLITEVKQVMWNEWGEADRYSGNTRGSRKAAANWKEDALPEGCQIQLKTTASTPCGPQ